MGYFSERMDLMGATAENLKLKLFDFDHERGEHKVTIDAFYEDKDGNIKIPVYTVDGRLLQIDNPKATPDRPNIENDRLKYLEITRLAIPREYKDEKGKLRIAKYLYPKDCESKPYFPKLLLENYAKRKQTKTLVLTEGYFKAWVACLHGLPCVGMQSISTTKERSTGAMYSDVIQYVQRCKVENIIWLFDGDCRNISDSSLKDCEDLFGRPAQFLASIEKVRELFKDSGVDVYYANINSDTIENNPKGLDDLLCELKGKEKNVVEDILSLSRVSLYCTRINVTKSLTKIYNHFCTNNIESFYDLHQNKIGQLEFQFKGTRYKYNEEKQKIEPVLSRDIKNFFRVGDDYYEMVSVPNKLGNVDNVMKQRLKQTIKDDFGETAEEKAHIISKIPKYKAFCNVPNHQNYQRVIHDCYNMYNSFPHQLVDGECPLSLQLIKHVFGDQYEIGLDYVQLLYQKPYERLPVLCLVSRENKTGKSTFIKLLREMFGHNSIIVPATDFEGEFNYHWVGKLLVMCEETKIEGSKGSERIKAISTADKMTMNRKGKDHDQVEFFGKFVLSSNHPEKFITVAKEDQRYWVIKLNTIEVMDPFFEDNVQLEIPHFLAYLNNRKLSVPKKLDRMWFPFEMYRTEALDRLIEANLPPAERELRMFLHDVFCEFEYFDVVDGEICYCIGRNFIADEVLRKRYSYTYIEYLVHEMPHKLYVVNNDRKAKRCKVPRYDLFEGKTEIKFYEYTCKPYIFKAKDYLSKDEYSRLAVDYELSQKDSNYLESRFTAF